MLARSGGAGELGEIVGGANHRPFGLHVLDAPQQELPEHSCLLDLSEDRFHDLLPQPVPASPSRPFEFVAHRAHQWPADVSLALSGMLCASRSDVSADVALGQGCKVGLAAITGIG